VQGAEKKFQQWIRIAGQLYHNSAQMIEQHLSGICNYFEHRTTSGVTEGINTKIKLIKRQGYGFNNFQHFRLRLLACFDSS
jgi:transposase